MILRSGKYKGMDSEDVYSFDPRYYRWSAENRPEMLVPIKAAKKKVELTEEELEQKNIYNTLPKLGWEQAFG